MSEQEIWHHSRSPLGYIGVWGVIFLAGMKADDSGVRKLNLQPTPRGGIPVQNEVLLA